MTQPEISATDEAGPRPSAAREVVGLVVAHASMLARAGQLDDAAAVLEGAAAGDPPDVRALDLLAKVRAQQGRWDEAELHWNRANAAQGAGAYDPSLKRLQALKGRPRWLKPLGLVVATGVACTALVIGGRLVLGGRQPRVVTAASLSAHPAIQPLVVPEAKPEPRAAPLLDLDGLAVRVVRRPEGAEVSFPEGLFADGTTLTTGGARALDELGARLRHGPPGLTAVVTGFTDDIPVASGRGFPNNQALGLARAVVAMDRLRASTGWPARVFLVGTAGGSDGQFPNDSSENRQRNRTAVILVRPQIGAQ